MRSSRPHSLALATVSLVAGILTSAGIARAERSTRVGIVITVKVNASAAEATAISDSMGTALHKEFGVDVISGIETERRLPSAGLPDECVAEATCRSDLGSRLDADELLLLVIVKLGDEFQVDSTWADVGSGDTVSRPQVRLGTRATWKKTLQESAPRLLPHIKKKPIAAPRPEIIVVPQKTTPSRRIPTGTWIAGGVAGAALIGGTILGISARQKFSALEEEGCRDTVCDPARLSSLKNRALASDVLFGVAGAAAITAIVLYATGDKTSDEKPKSGLRLQPGPGAIGVAVGGGF